MKIGGWPYDSSAARVVQPELEQIIEKEKIMHIVDKWCPGKRCSAGMIKFDTGENMWTWLRSMKGKKLSSPTDPLKFHWFSAEKTPEEAATSRKTGQILKVLVDKGLAREDLDADYRQVIVWYKDLRVFQVKEGLIKAVLENFSHMALHTENTIETMEAQLNSA